MRADEQERFTRALTRFLAQQCLEGERYSIPDKRLFSRFRSFWLESPERFDHPSLLGQFRVELAQRGFHSTHSGKHPLWLGLALKREEQSNNSKVNSPSP